MYNTNLVIKEAYIPKLSNIVYETPEYAINCKLNESMESIEITPEMLIKKRILLF